MESSGRRGLAPSNFLRELSSHQGTNEEYPRAINGQEGDPRMNKRGAKTTRGSSSVTTSRQSHQGHYDVRPQQRQKHQQQQKPPGTEVLKCFTWSGLSQHCIRGVQCTGCRICGSTVLICVSLKCSRTVAFTEQEITLITDIHCPDAIRTPFC